MEFKFVNSLIKQIIDAIQNTAIAAVRSINGTITNHTYKVDVKNPVKSVTVEGRVKVQNQKDVEREVKSVAQAVKNLEKALAPLKTVKVENFPKYPEFPKFPAFPKFPEHPKAIEVSNFRSVIDALDGLEKVVGKLKLDPKINVAAPIIPETVVNVPKAAPPVVNVEKPDLSAINTLVEFFQSLSAKKPLPTRLTDGKEFYKAVDRLADVVTANNSSDFMDIDGAEARAVVNGNNELVVTTADTWGLNHSEEIDTTTYLGKQDVGGQYRIMKIVDDGNGLKTLTYASIRNNPTVDNYSDAWDDRASLTYGLISESF